MKFLIDNYAEYNSSQAIYLQKHISDMEEHTSFFITEYKASVYDYFDRFNPDVYITSANRLSRDALLYLHENPHVKLILSISGTKNSDVLEIEEILTERKINCPFFITNANDEYMPFTKTIKKVRVMEGVDINMDTDPPLRYNIAKGVVVNQAIAVRNYDSTFHVMSTNKAIAKDIDICLPINAMKSILVNYDEIIFTDLSNHLPQLFFEAIYAGKKVYYDIKETQDSEKLDNICNKIFRVGDALNYKSTNKMSDFSELKSFIEEKHTSKNRTNTLLSQIPKG